jgi:hypothetical protein
MAYSMKLVISTNILKILTQRYKIMVPLYHECALSVLPTTFSHQVLLSISRDT